MTTLLVPLVAAILPFVLWPIELVAPYPHVVEELAKMLLVLAALSNGRRLSTLGILVASGIVFSFSETILYSFNLIAVGDGTTFLTRLVFTAALHTGTLMVLWFFAYLDRRLIIVGLMVAIALHYWYNTTVSLAG